MPIDPLSRKFSAGAARDRSSVSGQSAILSPAKGDSRKQLTVVILGAIGLAVWICLGPGRGIGDIRWTVLVVAGLATATPPVARIFMAALDAIRHPSRRAMNIATLVIAITGAGYLLLTAVLQDRDLFPKTHDDCSYVIGMQMLARFRLWMPALEIPDFFDSFYILVRPVYCSLYFPGAALMYVATVWLHLPTWVGPVLASGLAVGMMYRVFTELIDGVAGALAALMLVSLSWFRVYSILVTGHVPMLLLGLLMVWACLGWMRSRQIRWAMAIGVFAGWAAITRPADAAIFACPVGIAVLWTLFKEPSRRGWLAPAVIVAGAVPFLLLQLVFDQGVTGHVLKPPYGYYLEHDQPGSAFGFHPPAAGMKPDSPLLQKQELFSKWVLPKLRLHTPGNIAQLWGRSWLPMLVDTTMHCRLFLVFLPIGLLGMWGMGRRVLGATLPLFVLAYTFNPFFLEHYAIVVIPSVTLFILLGGESAASAWPRYRREIQAAFVAVIVIACMTSFWEINQLITPTETRIFDETFPSPDLRALHQELSTEVTAPAVVLFVYHAGDNYLAEPVYNIDVATPDEAPIIRAHDLGPERNREIFAYYARTQPDRVFWRFDLKQPDSLVRLGTAQELAARALHE